MTEQGGNIISPQRGSPLTCHLCSSAPDFVKFISYHILFLILLLLSFFSIGIAPQKPLYSQLCLSICVLEDLTWGRYLLNKSPSQVWHLAMWIIPTSYTFFGPMTVLSSSPPSAKVPLWDHLPHLSFSHPGHFPKPSFRALSSSFSLFSS